MHYWHMQPPPNPLNRPRRKETADTNIPDARWIFGEMTSLIPNTSHHLGIS
jgi:hypothetical protein